MSDPTTITLAKKIYAFVAYGSVPENARDPRGGDEPLVIRPQTFVRYAPAIQVKSITPNHDNSSVTVEFDGESVGYTKDIRAHLSTSDPGVNLLQAALQNKTPINVGIEARRKQQDDRRQPISRTVPIHALRGADEKGLKAKTDAVSANIGANVIAWIGGNATVECASDPQEWAELTNNATGLVAPAGWKVVTSPDWGEYSFIARDDNAPARGGSFPSADDLRQALYDVLVKFNDEEANDRAHSLGGVPSEGQPWKNRTSDNRFNLGHYSHGSYLTALSWWTKVLRAHPVWSGRADAPLQPLAHSYAQKTVDLVTQIVEAAYYQRGMATWAGDPGKKSWSNAWQHLRILMVDALDATTEAKAKGDDSAADELMVFVELDDNKQPTEASWRDWTQYWGSAATESTRTAAAFLDRFYAEEWPAKRKKSKDSARTDRSSQQREQRTTPSNAQTAPEASATQNDAAQNPDNAAQQPGTEEANDTPDPDPRDGSDTGHGGAATTNGGQSAEQPQPQLPGDPSIRGSLYRAVQDMWNDPEKLSSIRAKMKKVGLNTLEVSYAMGNDNTTLTGLADPDPNKGRRARLAMMIDWRIGELTKAASPAAAADTLGVATPPEDRIADLRDKIRSATSKAELDDLAELVRTEGLDNEEIMLDTAPSTIGVYLRFRMNQVGNTAVANAG